MVKVRVSRARVRGVPETYVQSEGSNKGLILENGRMLKAE
jgi:hypothetical protein